MDRNQSTYSEIQRRFAFGTKPFTYFEAGLPMIINSEYEGSARFIEENNLGFSISTEDLPNLKEKLKEIDYQSMKNSVQEYVRTQNMDQKIDDLINFYAKIGVDVG